MLFWKNIIDRPNIHMSTAFSGRPLYSWWVMTDQMSRRAWRLWPFSVWRCLEGGYYPHAKNCYLCHPRHCHLYRICLQNRCCKPFVKHSSSCRTFSPGRSTHQAAYLETEPCPRGHVLFVCTHLSLPHRKNNRKF